MTATAAGQEFKNDNRQTRPLDAKTIKKLTTINPLRSTISVLQTLGLIIGAAALAIYFWNIFVVIPVLIFIASRQQACFVLAHEAVHYRLYNQRWLNDLVGRFTASIVGISMCSYRVVHRLHHNHLYEKQDPDIPLHGGYPRGTSYLLKKLFKDLLGGTAIKTFSYFFGLPAQNTELDAKTNRPLDDTSPALRKAAENDRWTVLAAQIVMLSIAYYSGYIFEYLILWILPLLTILQPILRFRAICEHGGVTDLSSPLTASRTNKGPWWIVEFLFPHHVNYHIEHHLYPSIPHYNLKACHKALEASGALETAEVRDIRATTKLVAGLG